MFGSGVASGDPTPTSVVIWTRADTGAVTTTVAWSIAHLDGTRVRGGSVETTADRDHTVAVTVDGLEPATEYRYAFQTGESSVEGRTRTLPHGAERFRFVVACCSRWGWPGFELFDRIVTEQPDLVLHLGDSIYEIGEMPPGGTATDPPWDCHSLDDYRRRYRQHRTDPGWRRLLASMPLLAVWDDHEVVDNAPEGADDPRRRAGQQAWAEWMPMRPAGDPAPLDRTISIEGLLDLVLVDTRFAGRTPADTDGPDIAAERGRLLDDSQWCRLESAARASSTPWFALANQVQVGPMTLGAVPVRAWPPWRRLVNPDQWDGYPDERARLYDVLRMVRGRAVVLSGDLHSAWSRSLRAASAAGPGEAGEMGEAGEAGMEGEDGAVVAHEFTCPSISGVTYSVAVRERLPIPAPLLDRWLRLLNPGIDHLDLTRHGYLVCDVEPTRWSTTFVFADGERRTVTLTAG